MSSESPVEPELLKIEGAKDLILTPAQYIESAFVKGEQGKEEGDLCGMYTYHLKNKSGQEIYYFGSRHSNDPEDLMFVKIKKAFDAICPDIVLVEGCESINVNKVRVIEMGKRETDVTSLIRRGGESHYTLKLAIDAGVDFESPEPDMKDEIAYLEEKSFERDAVFAFYVFRQLHQYTREKPQQDSTEAQKSISQYLESLFRELQSVTQWEGFEYSIEHAQRVGRTFWKHELDLMDPKVPIQYVDPVPWPDSADSYTKINEVAAASSVFRDRYIVGRVSEHLKKNKRIFVVYGSAHAVVEEPALREIMK
jgi:hypothetical protein